MSSLYRNNHETNSSIYAACYKSIQEDLAQGMKYSEGGLVAVKQLQPLLLMSPFFVHALGKDRKMTACSRHHTCSSHKSATPIINKDASYTVGSRPTASYCCYVRIRRDCIGTPSTVTWTTRPHKLIICHVMKRSGAGLGAGTEQRQRTS